MRQCGQHAAAAPRLTDRKGLLLDLLSRAFRAARAKLGIAHQSGLRRHLWFPRRTRISPRCFPGFLNGLPEGGLVMCHPGHVDAELERLDPLTTLREREYAYFAATPSRPR